MNELIFLVQESPEGGYIAQALGGPSLFTQAETWEELPERVRDAVACHFDQENTAKPQVIRLHFVREKVIAA